MGNRKRPDGPDESSERSLFRVLDTKNASGGTGTSRRSAGRRYSGRHALWLCVVAAVIASAFVVIPFASSANPDISGFELDGNVAHDAATTPPDDWATLFNASGQSTGAGSALARTFVADGIGATDTGFTGGGSKDTGDIPNWGWSTGVTPAKDDIANAYAAAYAEQGNEIIYFGQERVDTQSGDANMGFWFLQDPTVGPNATGGFDGKHVIGDVLIQSSLTNGGGVSDIHVFKWTASGLTEVTGLAEGGCVGGKLGTLNACAYANTATITRPWGPNLKSPYFFEGGLNLSALFPGESLPCFSSFISNTRTSQSSSAVLKDFASGAIDTCGTIVIKKVTQPSGAAQKFDFTSDVAGNATFQLADGQSKTMDKLNPGTYHVSEGAPAAGWSFDSVSCGVGANYVQKSGANLTITLPLIGKVECTYVNKRDTGSLTLSKVLTGGPAGYTGPFTINYDCNDGSAHDGSKSVTAGTTSSAITGIPTGTQCTISETPPTAPTGYTFGAPSFLPSATVTITNKDQTVNVQTTNTLTRDTGSLKLSKVLTGGPADYTGPFTIHYVCDQAHTGDVVVNAGSFQTISGIPTGTQCTVSETPPTAPDGYTWGTPTFSPSATVTIAVKNATVEVTTNNTLSRDTGKITVVKKFVGAPEGSKVTLQIKSGATVAQSGSVADGGSISKVVTTGTYGVDETSAQGDVDLDLYDSSVICKNGESTVAENADGSDTSVTVAKGDDITCTITNTRKARSITVEKTVSATSGGTYVKAPDVATKPENGGTFFFKVKVTNTSAADTITVTDLADLVSDEEIDVDGLVCGSPEEGNGLPFTLAPGASITCTFTHDLIGNGGATETDHVDASWKDQEGTTQGPTSSNDAIIALTDVKPAISVTKTANPTVVQDSGLVTFTAVVTNTSSVDPLTIDTLTDSIYGNLLTGATKATCKFGGNVVSLPYTLPVHESLVCTFQATVTQTETDVVTSSGTDEEQNRVTAQDDATVTVNHTPPPPPPAPKTDVAIQKDATAQVTLGSNGQATIVYDFAVKNNGPDPAANVAVADPAPSGVTFASVAQQPSQGSCSIQSSGALLTCSIGTLAVGQSVAIKVNATVTQTGTITNTGTTTTTTPETNTANNADSAQTIVVAPAKPPVKPPVVAPEICNTVTVVPKTLKATGKTQKIVVKVTQGKKGVAGAKVKITGAGISKTVVSGKNGKVTVTIKPTRPGIIKVEIQNKKACNTQRIGVVGVFEPPVTG